MGGWTVAGNCPKCGGPVFVEQDSMKNAGPNLVPPTVAYSCQCRFTWNTSSISPSPYINWPSTSPTITLPYTGNPYTTGTQYTGANTMFSVNPNTTTTVGSNVALGPGTIIFPPQQVPCPKCGSTILLTNGQYRCGCGYSTTCP